METYVLVNFWLGVVALTINIIAIGCVEYPKQKTETLGQKVAAIIVGGGFTVWAGYLAFFM